MNDSVIKEETVERISLSEFLTEFPPGSGQYIEDLFTIDRSYIGSIGSGTMIPRHFNCAELRLYCEECEGKRTFRWFDKPVRENSNQFNFLLEYLCSDCQGILKVFALGVNHKTHYCHKIGEHPGFGEPIPSKLSKIFGKDSRIFLKGRQCENQSMGIGAFSYYRQIVEKHRDRIISEIVKVAKAEGASEDLIKSLEEAQKNWNFTNSVEVIKDIIPENLKIQGRNPLVLLHSALSEGLHAGTDEECLKIATAIREILISMTERIVQSLERNQAISDAIKTIDQNKK